jgi:hypothetical protein
MHGKSLLQRTDNAASYLEQLLNALLPAKNLYIPVIRKEQQQKQLERLNKNIPDESFYFTFNLLNCKLENVKGVEKWLGYSEKEFTVSQYLKCVHCDQSVLFNLMAESIYKILCKGIFKLRFATQKYITLVAMRQYDGEYYVYKKTTSVFQYDRKNRLLEQLNVFDKIGVYDGTALNPRVTETEGFQWKDFERKVFQMALERFMAAKHFSEKEFEVLICYATHEDWKSKDVAKNMKIEADTIKTFNKRILEKARNIFTRPFNNAREVAMRLKKERILE